MNLSQWIRIAVVSLMMGAACAPPVEEDDSAESLSHTREAVVATVTPVWRPAAAPAQRRAAPAQVRLRSGEVLVAGGGFGTALASAELYNPQSDTWSPAGTMSVAQDRAAALLLANGKVLVTGGRMDGGGGAVLTAHAELYEPSTRTWTQVAPMLSPSEDHALAELPDGKVLTVVGQSTALYDPVANTWTRLPLFFNEVKSRYSLLPLPSGKVLLVCSEMRDPPQLFDPVTRTWAPTGAMHTRRWGCNATRLNDGRILVTGGWSNALASYQATAELYDPASNTWSLAAPMARDRYDHAAALLSNGQVLIAGGGSSTSSWELASAEVYDPATNTWQPTASMPWGRSGRGWQLFPLPNGQVLSASREPLLYAAGLPPEAIDLGSATGAPVTTGNTCGLPDGSAPSCAPGSAPDAAFRWTAPSRGTFTFSTAGSTFDTALQVSDLATGASLGCGDNGATLQSSVTVSLQAGQQVRLAVDGAGGACGAFSLNIQGPLDCSTPRALAGGGAHTLALKADGTVWAWGRNDSGQLGDGTHTPHSTPVQVRGLSGATAVAAGLYHSLALKADGTVWTWGSNGYGQLGDGTTVGSSPVPRQVRGLPRIRAIASGTYHALALDGDGTVWTWGYNASGQLGDGTRTHRSTAWPVLSGVSHLVAGGSHALALKTDGTVWAWGSNGYGQLGDGTTTDRLEPGEVEELAGLVPLVAGGAHSVATRPDGTLWAWGDNGFGQLGNGSTTDSLQPVQVQGLSGTTTLVAGTYHTAALRPDGTLWAWGRGDFGQLGDGHAARRSTPVQVPGFSGTTAVAAGSYHTVALKEGALWAFGRDDYGQLGNGGTTYRAVPRRMPGLSAVTALAAGGAHSVTLHADGTAWAWGANTQGQLGDGSTTQRTTPVQVRNLPSVNRLAAGSYHTVALATDTGTVWAWGQDLYGAVGTGTFADRRLAPVQVQHLPRIQAIAGGSTHTVALAEDGTVWTWGRNHLSQLGNGGTTDSPTPGKVENLTDVIAIAAGASHTVALKADGTLWAWGHNGQGQLGDTTFSRRPRPVPVKAPAGARFTAIAAGAQHTLAVLEGSGTVWAWGANTHGQLGDGSTTTRPQPVQVSGLSGITTLVAGGAHSVALAGDGTLWAWGRDNVGQLGTATPTDHTRSGRTTPVPVQGPVQGLSGPLSLSAGSNHTLALDASGGVWVWGSNELSALGDGTPIIHKVPGLVQGPWGLCTSTPGTLKRGMTWVQATADTCGQTRVVCNDCDPYDGDTLCTEARPLLCIKKDGAANSCASAPPTFTDGWASGTVKLTPFLVYGTELTSLAVANALCASTFGDAGYQMAEFHDGGGGWGWRAQGTFTSLDTPASTHPRDGRANAAHRFWVHINDQPRGNCWN